MSPLAEPAALTLLVAPLALLAVFARSSASAMLYSSTSLLDGIGSSFRQRLLWTPPTLRVLCLTLLAAALSRPQVGAGPESVLRKAVAIEIVLDRSTSMLEPMRSGPDAPSRFDVARSAIRDFISGDGEGLPGRPDDLIGMVAFARWAHTVCPLTRAHDALLDLLRRTDVVRSRDADGTAIGEALALAAARLDQAERTLAAHNAGRPNSEIEIKSKVIVLLTDGRNNAGQISPPRAARLCAENDIRIYTMDLSAAPSVRPTPFGPTPAPGGDDEGQRMLEMFSQRTGGAHWPAPDVEALRRAYADLEALEKTEIRTTGIADRRERFQPLAIVALAAVVLETLLSATWLRRFP